MLENLPELPPWLVTILTAAGVTVAAGIAYLRKPAPAEKDSGFVVAGASLADTAPMREAVQELKRIGDQVERLAEAVEDHVREVDIEREAERRARQIVSDRRRSPKG